MENQHRHIAGYRELTAEEIDLMNRIKGAGASLLVLHSELMRTLIHQRADAAASGRIEHERFNAAEPLRWAAIGKTDIQTGVMALVRAVAQPEGV